MPRVVGKNYLIKPKAKEICKKVWGGLGNWNPSIMDKMCGHRFEYKGEYDKDSSYVENHLNGHMYFFANEAIEWEEEEEKDGVRYYPSHI